MGEQLEFIKMKEYIKKGTRVIFGKHFVVPRNMVTAAIKGYPLIIDEYLGNVVRVICPTNKESVVCNYENLELYAELRRKPLTLREVL